MESLPMSVATLTPPPVFFRVCVGYSWRLSAWPHWGPVQGSCCRPGIACRESDAECWVVRGIDFCGFRFLVLLCSMG